MPLSLKKMRIDTFLSQKGELRSRTEAKNYVEKGLVTVNGRLVLKPSYEVSEDDDIVVDKTGAKYVSRGGFKLEGAINHFNISPSGRRAIDIGASSGGFTDCLLKNGAKSVIAVDSGTNQLVEELRADSRVTVMENYNARYMKPSDFEYFPDFAVMDVSFISATLIIPALHYVLTDGADFICLIKPQFEVGREHIGKGGIVKDESARRLAIERVVSSATASGFEYVDLTVSSITGGDGNIEYLAYFRNRKR